MTIRISRDVETMLHNGFQTERSIVIALLTKLEPDTPVMRAACGLLYLNPYTATTEELDKLHAVIQDAKSWMERWLAEPPSPNYATNAQYRTVTELVDRFDAADDWVKSGPHADDGNAVGLTVCCETRPVYFHVLPDGSAHS